MAAHKSALRLYVTSDLASDTGVVLDKGQAHYAGNVMRRQAGDPVILFNGRDGEWLCDFQEIRKQHALVHVRELLRPQKQEPDIILLFAPLKKIQTSLVIQKATELGAVRLCPVQTVRTNADRIREDKMYLQAIEAAEQCERLSVPEISDISRLEKALDELDADRPLVFCDERFAGGGNLQVLETLKSAGKWSLLVGPEGGFSEEEKTMIRARDNTHAISLGPRILRAETAVIAGLSLLQATVGDWSGDNVTSE